MQRLRTRLRRLQGLRRRLRRLRLGRRLVVRSLCSLRRRVRKLLAMVAVLRPVDLRVVLAGKRRRLPTRGRLALGGGTLLYTFKVGSPPEKLAHFVISEWAARCRQF